MANVLPLDAQKRIRAAYRARFILAFSLLALVLALAAGLSLTPARVALGIAAPAEIVPPEKREQEHVKAVTRAQALVREVGPTLSSTSSPIAGVAEALRVKPEAVRVERILFERGSEESKLTLTGSASRDGILAFRTALTESGAFTSVTVPVGALVGSQGGRFQITLNGAF